VYTPYAGDYGILLHRVRGVDDGEMEIILFVIKLSLFAASFYMYYIFIGPQFVLPASVYLILFYRSPSLCWRDPCKIRTFSNVH
jgi:hypothetical protein